jgi:hypothetical protein
LRSAARAQVLGGDGDEDDAGEAFGVDKESLGGSDYEDGDVGWYAATLRALKIETDM